MGIELVFSLRAKADLKNIQIYTLNRWGEKQLVKYMRSFEKALHSIQKNPEKGRERTVTSKNVRSWRVGKHIVFYGLKNGQIHIIRILHENMDFSRNLG